MLIGHFSNTALTGVPLINILNYSSALIQEGTQDMLDFKHMSCPLKSMRVLMLKVRHVLMYFHQSGPTIKNTQTYVVNCMWENSDLKNWHGIFWFWNIIAKHLKWLKWDQDLALKTLKILIQFSLDLIVYPSSITTIKQPSWKCLGLLFVM